MGKKLLLLGLIGICLCIPCITAADSGKPALFAYVGAGIREPVIELGEMYEQKTGVKVEMTFNNSGALLSQMELNRQGDIFLPGAMFFVEQAAQKGFISESVGPIAYHVPVVITPKNNPARITGIKDLARPGVQIILPDKKATALGKSAFKIFDRLGITTEVEKNILAYVETPSKLIAAMLMGQGQAGIVDYHALVNYKDQLQIIEIDPAINEIEELPCAVLTFSTQKETARDFLQFVQVEGPAVFAKHGFKTEL